MAPARLLIVDDEVDMLEGLKRLLSYELKDVVILTVSRGRQALRLARREWVDLVLLDVRMPEMDGLQLLEVLRQEDPGLTVIMMTAYGSIEVAVEAMKHGAYDFITKPFDSDTLVRTVTKGLERSRLIRENRRLRRHLGESAAFQGLVGQSPPMRRLYERIQTVAGTDYTVLIRGESGTGKELVARAIHDLSRRARRPLVTVNCPAIPERLLESELFGYKKGAFTGADRDHPGLFQEAHGSSLFLDEIADISVPVQTKLLRVLQEQEIKPLGANRAHKVDVRILASTNQDIEAKIRERSFREDLYYRLNVVTLKTPPLRDIAEDIPLLAEHFARLASAELGYPPKRFAPETLASLSRRAWPGNARELQNFVRRAMMFSRHETISSEEIARMDGSDFNAGRAAVLDIRAEDGILTYKPAKERLLHEFTQSYVIEILQKTRGNVSQAATLSGLGRASFQKILRRLGIKPEMYRSG
ncbi:MAG: sigma-54 dependent transcriptional regulator [Deltaproteobacteria bacterium]|nr:sigma-54 dependent transcriptional regulator [Deltaproteobacteria bacterium]